MTTTIQIIEMLARWEAQPDSDQKTVVLSYWKKQARKLTTYNRKVNTNWVPVDAAEKKAMFRGLAKQYNQAIKKAGERVADQMFRLWKASGIV